jgi:hypothetical protein
VSVNTRSFSQRIVTCIASHKHFNITAYNKHRHAVRRTSKISGDALSTAITFYFRKRDAVVCYDVHLAGYSSSYTLQRRFDDRNTSICREKCTSKTIYVLAGRILLHSVYRVSLIINGYMRETRRGEKTIVLLYIIFLQGEQIHSKSTLCSIEVLAQ